jgi:hypothetical protein
MAASYIPTVGVNSSYGASEVFTKPDGFSTFIPHQLKIVTSSNYQSAETITVQIEASYFNNGTNKIVEKSFTAAETYYFDASEMAGLFKDDTYIKDMKTRAKSNKSTCSVMVTVTPFMFAM